MVGLPRKPERLTVRRHRSGLGRIGLSDRTGHQLGDRLAPEFGARILEKIWQHGLSPRRIELLDQLESQATAPCMVPGVAKDGFERLQRKLGPCGTLALHRRLNSRAHPVQRIVIGPIHGHEQLRDLTGLSLGHLVPGGLSGRIALPLWAYGLETLDGRRQLARQRCRPCIDRYRPQQP